MKFAQFVGFITWSTVLSLTLPPPLAVADAASAASEESIQSRLKALGKKSLDLNYLYTRGRYVNEPLRYRLFLPKPMKAGQKYPLIVWFHGGGDKGTDNLSHMRHFDTTIYPEGNTENCPFFVFALQCSRRPWVGSEHPPSITFDRSPPGQSDMLTAAMEILDQLLQEYPVNKDRITVVGISSGGTACWELLTRYPDRFAAVAPQAAVAPSKALVDSFVRTPIWAFHPMGDRSTVGGMRETIAAIQRAGGNAHLTVTKNRTHNSWTSAFNDYDLRWWLLAQQRGASESPSPGKYRLLAKIGSLWRAYWSQLVGVSMLVTLITVCYWQVKGQRRPLFQASPLSGTTATDSNRRAFTLIELLVVIGIIGVLVALMLPAIEMARESSRRGACANNLRQQAVAVRLHEQTHKTFPTGGWKDYLGDPDAGYGAKQPGGWIYNILSYIEEEDLRQLGKGLRDPPRQDAMMSLMESPIPVFYCPSRRLSQLYPYSGTRLRNATPPKDVAKTDYAINVEISFEKSEVIMPDIQLRGAGASRTILAGEKSLALVNYSNGAGFGDTLIAYVGDSEDIRRSPGPPISDRTAGTGFGGPHSGGANFAYCDGSVRFVSEDENVGGS